MDTEICGFLYVKSAGHRYIAQKVRKKSLVSSKVWKRLWCSIKKLGSGLGVQVQFDSKLGYSSNVSKQREKDNSVIIPPSAIIYRIHSKTKQFAFGISQGKERKLLLSLSANSETETQRWMENIRYLLNPKRGCCTGKSYNISMVDNAHSKAAGLIGLYGSLTATETGVFIKSPQTDEMVKSFEWKEFGQFHLMTVGRPEDVKRICVLHTTKEFCCGIGELYFFCLEANKLLQDLVTQGRGPKHKQRSLNFNDEVCEVPKQRSELIGPFSQQKSNLLCIVDLKADCFSASIHNEDIENVYQSIPANLTYNEESDTYNYGASNISIASGIYEEIVDNICSIKSKTNTSNVYEDTDTILCSLQIKPPPLPPRQRQKSEHIEEVRYGWYD
ncbi:PREDICTED: uncharacterized protein LOC106742180 isoform X2 [Dinoponera quadriceps]|uniref:Uncharacterized protein LOC106742180 isoform X2 n=1 Tax=Dinoponera quadriceps TaxID=609295 RepID=A0A6P3WXK8_DINQU|nr:PREDICTED: uncharacterized protein LOC106742180 isoform X2 [Dinoponera quadriceps]